MQQDNMIPAVLYLLRGADEDWAACCERFLASYRNFPADLEHQLYVILKGFSSSADLTRARQMLAPAPHREIETSDDGFDIGAYRVAAGQIPNREICLLNTKSEILGGGWLKKLALNLRYPGVGLVAATGSYESLSGLDPKFPVFPNPHLRSNAMMILRDAFLAHVGGRPLVQKLDAYLVESGPESLTNRVLEDGLATLVVGRNGRGYEPRWWPFSETFRQGSQSNLLVGDNQTRAYADAVFTTKRQLVRQSWGPFIHQPATTLPSRLTA